MSKRDKRRRRLRRREQRKDYAKRRVEMAVRAEEAKQRALEKAGDDSVRQN